MFLLYPLLMLLSYRDCIIIWYFTQLMKISILCSKYFITSSVICCRKYIHKLWNKIGRSLVHTNFKLPLLYIFPVSWSKPLLSTVISITLTIATKLHTHWSIISRLNCNTTHFKSIINNFSFKWYPKYTILPFSQHYVLAIVFEFYLPCETSPIKSSEFMY